MQFLCCFGVVCEFIVTRMMLCALIVEMQVGVVLQPLDATFWLDAYLVQRLLFRNLVLDCIECGLRILLLVVGCGFDRCEFVIAMVVCVFEDNAGQQVVVSGFGLMFCVEAPLNLYLGLFGLWSVKGQVWYQVCVLVSVASMLEGFAQCVRWGIQFVIDFVLAGFTLTVLLCCSNALCGVFVRILICLQCSSSCGAYGFDVVSLRVALCYLYIVYVVYMQLEDCCGSYSSVYRILVCCGGGLVPYEYFCSILACREVVYNHAQSGTVVCVHLYFLRLSSVIVNVVYFILFAKLIVVLVGRAKTRVVTIVGSIARMCFSLLAGGSIEVVWAFYMLGCVVFLRFVGLYLFDDYGLVIRFLRSVVVKWDVMGLFSFASFCFDTITGGLDLWYLFVYVTLHVSFADVWFALVMVGYVRCLMVIESTLLELVFRGEVFGVRCDSEFAGLVYILCMLRFVQCAGVVLLLWTIYNLAKDCLLVGLIYVINAREIRFVHCFTWLCDAFVCFCVTLRILDVYGCVVWCEIYLVDEQLYIRFTQRFTVWDRFCLRLGVLIICFAGGLQLLVCALDSCYVHFRMVILQRDVQVRPLTAVHILEVNEGMEVSLQFDSAWMTAEVYAVYGFDAVMCYIMLRGSGMIVENCASGDVCYCMLDVGLGLMLCFVGYVGQYFGVCGGFNLNLQVLTLVNVYVYRLRYKQCMSYRRVLEGVVGIFVINLSCEIYFLARCLRWLRAFQLRLYCEHCFLMVCFIVFGSDNLTAFVAGLMWVTVEHLSGLSMFMMCLQVFNFACSCSSCIRFTLLVFTWVFVITDFKCISYIRDFLIVFIVVITDSALCSLICSVVEKMFPFMVVHFATIFSFSLVLTPALLIELCTLLVFLMRDCFGYGDSGMLDVFVNTLLVVRILLYVSGTLGFVRLCILHLYLVYLVLRNYWLLVYSSFHVGFIVVVVQVNCGFVLLVMSWMVNAYCDVLACVFGDKLRRCSMRGCLVHYVDVTNLPGLLRATDSLAVSEGVGSVSRAVSFSLGFTYAANWLIVGLCFSRLGCCVMLVNFVGFDCYVFGRISGCHSGLVCCIAIRFFNVLDGMRVGIPVCFVGFGLHCTCVELFMYLDALRFGCESVVWVTRFMVIVTYYIFVVELIMGVAGVGLSVNLCVLSLLPCFPYKLIEPMLQLDGSCLFVCVAGFCIYHDFEVGGLLDCLPFVFNCCVARERVYFVCLQCLFIGV
eukprot:gene13196-9042_t